VNRRKQTFTNTLLTTPFIKENVWSTFSVIFYMYMDMYCIWPCYCHKLYYYFEYWQTVANNSERLNQWFIRANLKASILYFPVATNDLFNATEYLFKKLPRIVHFVVIALPWLPQWVKYTTTAYPSCGICVHPMLL
jgi:hypothetical protein